MARFDDDRLKNTGAQHPLSGGSARKNRSSVTGRRIHEAKSSGPSVGLVALILACVVAVVVTVAIVNRQPVTTGVTSEAAKNETTAEQKTTENGTNTADKTKEETKDEAQKKETTTAETKPVSAGDTAATPNKNEENAETAKIGNDYNADKKEGENAEGEASKDAESQSDSEGKEDETKDAVAATDTSSSSSKVQNGDWIDAEACASSAAETGAGPTASGIDFDDSTPQVALQRSSDSASHFGEYVEIKYGDQTVKAQVVDHGGLHSGENGILLNPGVFEAFGATSSDDWGRREVTYRFV